MATKKKTFLTLADMMARAEVNVKEYYLDGFDSYIHVKQFSAKDRKAIVKQLQADEMSLPEAYIRYGVCDEEGNQLFDDESMDELMNGKETFIAVLYAAVQQVNSPDEKIVAKN